MSLHLRNLKIRTLLCLDENKLSGVAMKLIAGGLNGNYLRDLLTQAPDSVEWVKAAIAYASGTPDLIEFCVKRKLRLEFWGRIDETLPVSIPILERFLKLGPNYTCKLIWRHYHPKVIRFGGYGVYIGSANLTDSAWFKNVECGVFMTEEELAESGFAEELDDIFEQIDAKSVFLTEPLLARLRDFEKSHFSSYSELENMKKDSRSEFEKSIGQLVPNKFEGLSIKDRRSLVKKRHEGFLTEWAETIHLMKQIEKDVISDEYRPSWISADAAPGVQIDQFLHGFYYHHVIEGNRSLHEEFFVRNRANPQASLVEAMKWWRSLPEAPSGERKMIEESAPLLKTLLAENKVLSMSKEEWISACERVNAFWTAARQVKNVVLGLPEKTKMEQPDRVKFVASWIYDQQAGNGQSVLQVVHYVLYGGPLELAAERLWEGAYDYERHVPQFGLGCLGEMIGWAMPDKCPPRNGRSSKALRALGFNVRVHSE